MPTALKVGKDPDDVEDFTWDWLARLATGETISAATVTATGATAGTSNIVGSTVVGRITGGTVGTLIRAQCRITTSTGRQLDWTLEIPCVAQ